MSWKIGMPNLGHTMEEGKVAEWVKVVGDRVARGDVVAIVETEKASFDVEAPADGVLLAIDVPAGTVVPVGSVIGTIGQPGESAPAVPTKAPATQPAPAASTEAPFATPPPARGRVPASPAARALAAELGVELAGISGTGEGGMITRDDVKAAASAAAARSPGAEPLPPMRRAIAEATERAWRTIPHVTLMRRADVTDLVTTKRHSLTAAVVRATAIALMKHLRFNGWLVDGAFHARADADIGVAVSAGGLRMPVVRAAQKLPVNAIAAEIESLAASAKAGALEGSRLTDASFSVSSLGRWGVEAFTPVIAGPQVAILGIGAVDRVAREAPGGGIHFRSEMTLSLVFDHRANDGAEAAEFLADIVAGLSDPASLEA